MTSSGYDLLAQRQFRNLWGANLILNLGLSMLMLGAAWVMTAMTDSPLLVSMVQTSMSLPFLLFSIPIGLATDRMGYRRMLLLAQAWMLLATALLAFVALPDWWELTPLLLLPMLALIGVGVVAQQAAWKPLLQDLVAPEQLVAAISLNSLGSRIAQAVGPALGGYLMGVAGTAVVLFTRVLSHLVMIVALLRITETPTATRRVPGSFRDGWHTVAGSPRLYGPMIRCLLLMAPCGGVLALLPLEAKENIQTGVIGYGGLLTALGIGAAAGMSAVPALQHRVRFNVLSVPGLIVFALAAVGISQWDSMFLDAAFLLFLGFSWSVLSVGHQFAVQSASPPDRRGLTIALYTMVLQGSVALGSFGFGLLAEHTGVSRAILIAGLISVSGLVLVRRYPIPDTTESSL